MSDSPPERDISWSTEGVEGAWRHLNRVWRLTKEIVDQTEQFDQEQMLDADAKIDDLIFDTSKFIENFSFNKAIAKIYELTNFLAAPNTSIEQKIYGIKSLAILMEPFTPHLAQEIWSTIGQEGLIASVDWPDVKEKITREEDQIILPIQINGKRKTQISVASSLTENAIKDLVLKETTVKKVLMNTKIKRFIYVPKRIINLVI